MKHTTEKVDVKVVSICLKSVIDGDEMQFSYRGEYRVAGSSHCIAYTDYSGNTVTKVGIEANKTAMLLHRVGGVTADMLFDPASDTVVKYDALSLIHGFLLHTYSYCVNELEGGLCISVDYGLNDGSEESEIHATQEIRIIFLEGNNENDL